MQKMSHFAELTNDNCNNRISSRIYYNSDHLGAVIGNTIRARHLGKDIMAGFKTIIGGEIKEYTGCLLYTSPSPRDVEESRMPSSA